MSTIAFTGLHGELGSFLVSNLRNLPDTVVDLYHTIQSTEPNITNHILFDLLKRDTIQAVLKEVSPDCIIHLAGITHIDRCQQDEAAGKNGVVWKTNVDAVDAIASYCAQENKHLIYLSTECVFDGTKTFYTESDQTKPKNWYGKTKAQAEQIIQESGAPFTILRAVIAYVPNAQNTLWQKVSSQLRSHAQVTMAGDHTMTPTYLPDLVQVIDACIAKPRTGIYHVTPQTSITPYYFAQKISEHLGYSRDAVVSKPLAEIIGEEKASLRLEHACLDSTQTQSIFELHFASIDEVIESL